MKQLYCILASFLLFLFTSCNNGIKEKKTLQVVKIDTVILSDKQTYLQYPGKVKAAQDINLAFKVSGTIQKIYVENGMRVHEGQLLAELDPTDYQVQLNATEAEYLQIKKEAERVMALYKDNGTTPNANDKAVYGLKQITAKYQHHKNQLKYTRLYAPFNGFIQNKLFETHETIGEGMPILSMINEGMPEVEINLPAAEYIHREQFTSYHCTFDIYPDKIYELKLISVSPKANANQLYTMRMQLIKDKQAMPSPGMNTMVTIFYNKDNSQNLSVPSGAILQKDGKAQVFVYNPSDNKVSIREVTLLRLLSNGRSLIRCNSLKPGQLIISSGAHYLNDGEIVTPLPAITKTNIGGLL